MTRGIGQPVGLLEPEAQAGKAGGRKGSAGGGEGRFPSVLCQQVWDHWEGRANGDDLEFSFPMLLFFPPPFFPSHHLSSPQGWRTGLCLVTKRSLSEHLLHAPIAHNTCNLLLSVSRILAR